LVNSIQEKSFHTGKYSTEDNLKFAGIKSAADEFNHIPKIKIFGIYLLAG
jgi:hypothetical protein